MLRTCCVLLLCIAGSRQLSITEFAVPSAVEAGENAELQCRYTESDWIEYIKWWWTPLYAPTDDRNKVLIYQRLSGQPAELGRKNIKGKENDTIVLLDLQSTDSGVYECEVSGEATIEARKHQDLIVFSNGTDLQLNISKLEDGPDEDDDEDVLVQCEAHAVTPQPELSIFVNGQEIANLTQYVTGGDEGLYDVYVNATLSDDAVQDAEVRCELFFENRNISHPAYVNQIIYASGAGRSTTEAPEDTTLTEMASELQNNGVDGPQACLWILNVAAIVQMYSYSLLNL